jgi:phenylacetate-CoA ligase
MAIAPTLSGPIRSAATLLRDLRRASQEQWLPAKELASRRRTRLRHVLVQAARAPYYAGLFREAGIEPSRCELRDLERLPLLDRGVISRHGLGPFLTEHPDRLFGMTTSGSTGTPFRFMRSKHEESDFSARWWRVYQAYGCSMRDAQINIASARKPDRSGPVMLLRRMGLLPRVERIDSLLPPEQVLERVREMSPPILTGYAGAIEALADHVLATASQVRPPRAVFCTAMEVTDRCLELAERAFRAPAVDVYVTNEFGVMAWSCPAHRNVLHVNDDALVLEVVGPEGEAVPPGTLGELLVTSLRLTSMPLIRYRMGDTAAQIAEPCSCGRGLGLLTRVQGRTAHTIRRRNGALITTPVITSLFGRAGAYTWVRGFQVREEPGSRLRFLVNPRRRPSDAQRLALAESVQTALGQEFQIAFEDVNRIPTAPSGKLQFLVPLPAEQPALR